MKKNKMMRTGSGVLIATLLTTGVISGTLSKYMTGDSAADAARIAKWGVELQAEGSLYGKAYSKAPANVVAVNNADGATVQTSNTSEVVAPGTKNQEGFTFSLKGQPEVSGKVMSEMEIRDVFLAAGTYGQMIPVDEGVVTTGNFEQFNAAGGSASVDSGLYYKDGDVYKKATTFSQGVNGFYTLEDYTGPKEAYYPISYKLSAKTKTPGASGETVTGTEYTHSNLKTSSLKGVADAIATQLGMGTGVDTIATDGKITYTNAEGVLFDPNTNLAESINLDDERITWEWAFTGHDAEDTILGLLENSTEGTVVKQTSDGFEALTEYTDYCLEPSFFLSVAVEQID